jgi:site-specific DNA-methyltransferase (adenine-specific)
MTPTDILGNIKLYNADCMEVMKTFKDKQFDLAIVDPPYGLERFKKGGSHVNKYGNEKGKWNNEKPTVEYFDELFRVSKCQIVWGGNNFHLPTSEYFIIWQKGNAVDFSFAMCEYAWTNAKKPAKLFTHYHASDKDIRIHPTQKPVQLYKWLLQNYAKEGDTILDTHFGSLSIGVACHDMKFDLTAIELDKDYYEQAKQRLINHQRQLQLF